MVAPFPEVPSRTVVSRDGTPIAVFSAGAGRALVLVHGTTGDHRTWRVVGPSLAERHALHAIDRRGRGDSGDAPGYAIERELEDVAAVAEAVAAGTGAPVGVMGHSLGGRIALGASLRTAAVGRVVAIEGAPTADPARPRSSDAGLAARLRADLAAGDLEGLLARFMVEGTGMPREDLERFRADPVWPLRVRAAPTIVRELEAAETDPAVSLDALGAVRVPVLQVAGSASPAVFRAGAERLAERLVRGSLVVIDGARHAPHHSHPAQLIAAVEAFLGS